MASITSWRSLHNEIQSYSNYQDLPPPLISRINDMASRVANIGNQTFLDNKLWYQTKIILLIKAAAYLEELEHKFPCTLLKKDSFKRHKHIKKLKIAIRHCGLGKAGRSKKAALTVQLETQQAEFARYARVQFKLMGLQLEAAQDVVRMRTEIPMGPPSLPSRGIKTK